MNPIGLLIYLILIGISHVCFGLFSTNYRFNKIVTYISYAAFYAFFIGISFLKLDFGAYFSIVFGVYLVVYCVLSKGKIFKNLFLITSYLTFIMILFGLTFAILFIDGFKGAIAVRWVILVLVIAAMESLLYLFFIPHFSKVSHIINKGWSTLLVSDLFYTAILYMQVFHPYQLKADQPWGIVLFLLCSFVYVMIFFVVIRGLETALSYSEEKSKNHKLQFLAHFDSLTNLYNRAYFDSYSETLLKEHEQNKISEATIIVIDINKFKVINDTYGHARGDEVLKQVAGIMKETFSDEKYINFRVGGDEFCVIAKNCHQQEIDNIIALFKKQLIEKINVSIAAGYSNVDYSNIDALATAFKNADKSMYQEKLR